MRLLQLHSSGLRRRCRKGSPCRANVVRHLDAPDSHRAARASGDEATAPRAIFSSSVLPRHPPAPHQSLWAQALRRSVSAQGLRSSLVLEVPPEQARLDVL
jgi:hypothetical protein